MKSAAEAGLAPHIRYSSLEDELFITEFVEEADFPAMEALVKMPAALRTLHALPPFLKALHRRAWMEDVNLADSHTRMVYGRVHWEELVRNMRDPRYNEALRIVSEWDACP